MDFWLWTRSWSTPATGIADVAQVVFVRKRLVEIQYLQTTITDEQRQEFSQLVEDTIRRIEECQFLPHSDHPLSPESMYELPLYRALLGKSRAG